MVLKIRENPNSCVSTRGYMEGNVQPSEVRSAKSHHETSLPTFRSGPASRAFWTDASQPQVRPCTGPFGWELVTWGTLTCWDYVDLPCSSSFALRSCGDASSARLLYLRQFLRINCRGGVSLFSACIDAQVASSGPGPWLPSFPKSGAHFDSCSFLP